MTTYNANITWPTIQASSGTDAVFRTRIGFIEAGLAGCGLVQTSDTGQISSATATVPGNSNTDAGYQIWRFSDSVQGTYPIFLRIVYGSGAVNNGHFRFTIRIGTGSDGSGTLTGQTSSVWTCGDEAGGNNANILNTTVTACHTEGWFHICVGPNSGYDNIVRTPLHFAAVQRSTTPTMTFDGHGAFVFANGSGSHADNTTAGANALTRLQGVRFASPAATGTGSSQYMLAVGRPTNTALPNGDKRIYPVLYSVPDVRVAFGMVGILGTEIGLVQSTFSAAPVNNTSRTYIYYGNGYGAGVEATSQTGVTTNGYQIAYLWE